MARVTVEDCVDKVENRFDLVLLASHRARMVSAGQQITIERDNDKNPVVALREIAEQTVTPEDLREELIHTLQKYTEVDEPEPEAVPLIPQRGGAAAGGDTDEKDVAYGSDDRRGIACRLAGPAAAAGAARRARGRRRGRSLKKPLFSTFSTARRFAGPFCFGPPLAVNGRGNSALRAVDGGAICSIGEKQVRPPREPGLSIGQQAIGRIS